MKVRITFVSLCSATEFWFHFVSMTPSIFVMDGYSYYILQQDPLSLATASSTWGENHSDRKMYFSVVLFLVAIFSSKDMKLINSHVHGIYWDKISV